MKKLLVIVDMQNDFIDGPLGTKEAQAIVPDMVEYIKNFYGDIVVTQDTHQNNYLNTQEGKKLPVIHCIEGTDGWEINPDIQSAINSKKESYFIYKKPTFGSIDLANFIKSSVYDEVIFCGVCTGICVISNVLLTKAFCPELTVKVVEKLCACVTPESHKAAIDTMRTCQVDII